MRLAFTSLLLLCLSVGILQAQHAWLPWSPASGKTIQPSQKTASHEDFPELCHQFVWHDSLVAWDSVYMETNTYSVNGDLTERIGQQYNGNGFVPQRRSEFTYISPGKQSSETSWLWNGSNWVEDYRTEMAYDGLGNNTLFLNYYWTGQNWDTAYGQRNTYSYVFTDRISMYTEEFWDSTAHVWENSGRIEYNFPTVASWDTTTYYFWNGSVWQPDERFVDVLWYDFDKELAYAARNQAYGGSGWEDVARFRCTFGAYDSPTYVWDDWNGVSWDSTTKDVTRYDAHAHEILSESFDWIGAWQQSSGFLSHYTYDNQDRTTEVINELFDGYIYRFAGRRTYPTFFTGQSDAMEFKIQTSVYPNPCAEHLTIGFETAPKGLVEISIYDLRGQLRLQTRISALQGGPINIQLPETMENGCYSYRISTQAGIVCGKLNILHE